MNLRKFAIISISIIGIVIVTLVTFTFTSDNITNDNTMKSGTAKDLALTISTNNDTYSTNSTSIIVHVTLSNVNRDAVYIEKRFDVESNLKIELFSPLNETLSVKTLSSTHMTEKELLQSGSFKNYSFDLRSYQIVDSKGNEYNWTQLGEFRVTLRYLSLSGDAIASNTARFSMIP